MDEANAQFISGKPVTAFEVDRSSLSIRVVPRAFVSKRETEAFCLLKNIEYVEKRAENGVV